MADQEYVSAIFNLMNSCANLGAVPFRFFTDKGIHSFSVYLSDDFFAKMFSLSSTSDITVTQYFSSTDHIVKITSNKHITCRAVDTSKKADTRTYCLLVSPTDKLLVKKIKALNYIPVYLSKVLNYSLVATQIFDKLTDLTVQQPGLKVLIVEPPWLSLIKNKSGWERSLMAKQPLPDKKLKIFHQLGYSDDYVKEVSFKPKQVWDAGMAVLTDKCGRYVNFRLGVRVTTDTPDEPDAYVHFCGQSMVYGCGVDDGNTICSSLQRELNTLTSQKFEVINRGNGGNPNYKGISSVLCKTKFRNRDIIVIMTGGLQFALKHYPRKFSICRPISLFHRPHDLGEVYIDRLHFNSVGSNAVAQYIFKTMKNEGFFASSTQLSDNDTGWIPPSRSEQATSGLSHEETAELMQSLTELQQHRLQIGSIVMNCNPFTLGHRYLVEHAASRVTRLYVFVVEEDRSLFKFSDRLELVRRGTVDLKNVIVIPSGRFIISQRTFEAYSNKENLQDKVIDPSLDIELFGRYIAPSLGINIRFAGEEPLDNVTRQYNATMRRLLPQYGVDFEIIARKESGDEVISASRVRKLLKDRNFDEIALLVPECTLHYLKNMPLESKMDVLEA